MSNKMPIGIEFKIGYKGTKKIAHMQGKRDFFLRK